jgi:hypothetical protein
MRNGIYRVWVKGPVKRTAGAVMLKDGVMAACNPAFGFIGDYRLSKGQFSAEIACRRLNHRSPVVNMPNLDAFQLKLEGPANKEFACLNGTIVEVPSFALPFEFAWLCEA